MPTTNAPDRHRDGVATTRPAGGASTRNATTDRFPRRAATTRKGPASMVAAWPSPTTVHPAAAALQRRVSEGGMPWRRTCRARTAADAATVAKPVRRLPASHATAAAVGQGRSSTGASRPGGVWPGDRPRFHSGTDGRVSCGHDDGSWWKTRDRRLVADAPALVAETPDQVDVLADPEAGIEAADQRPTPGHQCGGGDVAHRAGRGPPRSASSPMSRAEWPSAKPFNVW